MASTPQLPHGGAATVMVTLPGEIDMARACRTLGPETQQGGGRATADFFAGSGECFTKNKVAVGKVVSRPPSGRRDMDPLSRAMAARVASGLRGVADAVAGRWDYLHRYALRGIARPADPDSFRSEHCSHRPVWPVGCQEVPRADRRLRAWADR